MAPVNETALTVLRSSFVKRITFTPSRRSADIVLSVASEGTDLDPDVNIIVRRVAAFRRYCYRQARSQVTIKEMYEIYEGVGKLGRGPGKK